MSRFDKEQSDEHYTGGDTEPPYDDPLDGCCERCDGTGMIIVCCDDMCQGAGECIHGDGEIVCPNCHGEG